MKIIIDISKERLDSIKHFGIKQNEISMLERALISGTPLDSVKTEIASKVPSDKLDDAYVSVPYVFEILDKTSKESDDKK